jgi:hypothetical protein
VGRIVFTSVMGPVLMVTLTNAWNWPVRASIIVLTLGGVGVVLAAVRLAIDCRGSLVKTTQEVRSTTHRWPTLHPVGVMSRSGVGSSAFTLRFT